jgi:hypothetical protein
MVPSSDQIVHDVNKVFESMETVRLALGVHCPGVGSRNYGVWYVKVDKKSSGGGGHRKKAVDDFDDIAIHCNAAVFSVKVKTEDSLSHATGNKTAKLGKWMKDF